MDEAIACLRLAKANERSMESNVGPSSAMLELPLDVGPGIFEEGCGDLGFAGWNRHMVTSFLKSGVLVEATAFTYGVFYRSETDVD